MLVEEMRDKLPSLYVLPITPFKANFDLDLEGMRENIRFLLDNGINGKVGFLIPGAGMGEGVYMSLDEQKSLVKAVLDEAQGEILVFPGVHLYGTLDTIKYCKQLREMGVDGIQLAPPASYASPSDDDIVYHYKRVAEAFPELGIFVYNTHWEWGGTRDMTPDLIGRLIEIENIVGMKFGSKTLSNYTICLERYAKKVPFFNNMGCQTYVMGHMLGERGFLGQTPEVSPKYNLGLRELIEEKKYAEAWELIEWWGRPHRRVLEGVQNEGKHWIAFFKALVEIAGLNAGPPRPPQTPLTKEQYKRVENLVEETGILK